MKWLRRIPTLLTFSRAVLCPIILVLFLQARFPIAISLFFLAVLTDFLDGFLARRWNAVSSLGSLLDPLIDKAFALCFFMMLMLFGLCPAWFLGLSITLAIVQTMGYLFLRGTRDHELNVSVSWLGKWSSALQALWIGLLLLFVAQRQRLPPVFPAQTILTAIYAGLAAVQIAVLYSYVLKFRHVLFPEVTGPASQHQ